MSLISNATLLVGDTGTGKTTLLATLAEYVYQKYKKVSRLYTWDAGGFGDQMEALVEAGIVEVWKVRTIDPTGHLGLPTGVLARATLGWWPVEVDAQGHCDPGAELVPPSTQHYDVYCPQGHKVMRIQTRGQLNPRPCPTCSVMTTKENLSKIEKVVAQDPRFARVGALLFDGLTSMSSWGIVDMNARAAKNELGGESGNMRTVHSAGMAFGTGGRGAVGFVQNRAYEWVTNAITIPGMVVPPTFTALELRATDEGGLPIYGPQLVGRAKTAEVPSWVGNCLGTVIMETEKGMQHRLYLREYMLNDRIPHLCKVRALPNSMPDFLADELGEAAFTRFNLGYFYSLTHAAKDKAADRLKLLFPELKDGKVEVATPAAPVEMVVGSRTELDKKPSGPPPTAPAGSRPPAAQAATTRPPAARRPTPTGKPGVRPPAGAPPGARPRR